MEKWEKKKGREEENSDGEVGKEEGKREEEEAEGKKWDEEEDMEEEEGEEVGGSKRDREGGKG
jgi:hypothetical protein